MNRRYILIYKEPVPHHTGNMFSQIRSLNCNSHGLKNQAGNVSQTVTERSGDEPGERGTSPGGGAKIISAFKPNSAGITGATSGAPSPVKPSQNIIKPGGLAPFVQVYVTFCKGPKSPRAH